jgi:hypothetical protein
VLSEIPPTLLERRTPGETDLRVFTAEVIPAGRHRLGPGKPGLQAVRNRVTGRAALRTWPPTVLPDGVPSPVPFLSRPLQVPQ